MHRSYYMYSTIYFLAFSNSTQKFIMVNIGLKTVQITIFYYCYLTLLVPSSLADEMVIKQ